MAALDADLCAAIRVDLRAFAEILNPAHTTANGHKSTRMQIAVWLD
jgi:hypothetical protein